MSALDVEELVALAAITCTAGRAPLETVRTVLANVVCYPEEEKYRSVSAASLQKRGLTPECFALLRRIGFKDEQGRMCFRSTPGPEFHEAWSSVEAMLQQKISEESPGQGDDHERDGSRHVEGQSMHSSGGYSHAARMPQNQSESQSQHPGPVVDQLSPSVQPSVQPTADEMSIDFPRTDEVSIDMPALRRSLSDNSQQVLETFESLHDLGDQRDAVGEAARLLLSLAAAVKQGLLSSEQCSELHVLLIGGGIEDVRDIISGIGVCEEMESSPQEYARWDCPVCFTEQDSDGWSCPSHHRFCMECMGHHVEAVPFPRCPQCTYELSEKDFMLLAVPESRIEAFRHAKLCGAVDTLAGSGEHLVRCSQAQCTNVVLVSSTSGRQRFACSECAAPPFCTHCRQSPYHYHAECNTVQPLREQWLAWISGGREEYHGKARTAEESGRRNQALYEAIARHNELEADEQWKAQNCRLCPGCQRPISKIEGCDSMVCGRAYHGGDQQPGCGREFDWGSAAPYVARVERRALPELATQQIRLRGREVFHPFTDCSLCGRQGLPGLRFRCIHCEACDVCSECEPQLGNFHDSDHVFEILFESDMRCPWLPRGTRVRIVRCGNLLPSSLTRNSVTQLEGLFGKVVERRRPPLEGYRVELELGQGTVDVASEHLEPVITSRAAAEELLARTLEEDGEEPLQPQQPAQPAPELGAVNEVPYYDFADDSPLSSESDMPQQPARRRRTQPPRPPRHQPPPPPLNQIRPNFRRLLGQEGAVAHSRRPVQHRPRLTTSPVA